MLFGAMPEAWSKSLTSTSGDQTTSKQAKTALLLSMSEKVKKELRDYETCHEVWKKAKELYGVPSRLETALYLAEFWGKALKAGEDVVAYVQRKQDLASTCSNQSVTEDDVVLSVLAGTRQQFESVVENISEQKQLSSEYLKQRLRDAQQSRELGDEPTGWKSSVTALKAINMQDTDASLQKCQHCGKTGHQPSRCWKVNKCSRCGKRGHPQWRCSRVKSQSSLVHQGNLADVVAAAVKDALSSQDMNELIRSYFCSSSNCIVADSGASSTMFGQIERSTQYQQDGKSSVRVADDRLVPITGRTKKTVGFPLPDGSINKEDIDIVHVKDLGNTKLLSISKTSRGGRQWFFDEHGCQWREAASGKVLAVGELVNGLYLINADLNVTSQRSNDNVISQGERGLQSKENNTQRNQPQTSKPVLESTKIMDLHRCLGHRNYRDIQHLQSQNLITGFHPQKKLCFCESCAIGKAKRKPLPQKKGEKLHPVGEVITSDVCGKLPVQSIEGAYYFVTFIEARSRKKFTYLLRQKNQVVYHWYLFKNHIQRQTGRAIKILRTDSGVAEYCNIEFTQDLQAEGIKHQRTVKNCSNQNQISERSNYTLLDAARTLLYDARLPGKFWGLAVLYASHVSQYWSHPTIPNTTPYHEFKQLTAPLEPKDISYLKPFGCDAYAFDEGANKLQDRAKKYVMVGYAENQKGYVLYSDKSGKVSVHRHVTFDVDSFGGRTLKDHHVYDVENEDAQDGNFESGDDDEDSDDDDTDNSATDERVEIPPIAPRRSGRQRVPREFSQPMVNINEANIDENSASVPDDEALGIRREEIAKEISNVNGELESHETMSANALLEHLLRQKQAVSNEDLSSGMDDIDRALIACFNRRQSDVSGFSAKDTENSTCRPIFEPATYHEAITCKDKHLWLEAIRKELSSLYKLGTFEDLHDLPEKTKALGCKWVFKVKYKPSADKTADPQKWVVDKYKARICLQGYAQRKNVDYFETFSPVVRMDILRMILTLSLDDAEILCHQMDVKNAFPNADLDETIYMKAPPGHISDAPYVKLLKALYGAKQSPRAFHSLIDKYLQSQGYTKVKSCNCVYVKRKGGKLCIIALYVDDLILVGHPELLFRIKKALSERFEMKDLGELKYALGIEIHRNKEAKTITLSQEKYVCDVLVEHGFDKCKPVSIPAPIRLSKEMSPRSDAERKDIQREFQKMNYRKIIGQLLWICNTRPDICFSVSQAARFVADPGRDHFRAVKHILKYLRGTSSKGLKLSCGALGASLSGYNDSDFAGDPDTRRSTFGYLINLGSSPISFKSKLAPTVALSSCEAEYVSACVTAQEILFLRQVLSELGFPQSSATVVYEDNQSCIAHARNADNHSRMKHIDVKKYFVRELVQANLIEHRYIATTDMVADLFTKPLGSKLHSRFTSLCGVVSV